MEVGDMCVNCESIEKQIPNIINISINCKFALAILLEAAFYLKIIVALYLCLAYAEHPRAPHMCQTFPNKLSKYSLLYTI